PVSDIYFFETITDLTKRKLSVYTKSQHFVVKGNLKSIETKSDSFIRVHRSFVANVGNIKKFDSKEKKLYFNESTYCLVSRKNIGPLKNILKERFMEM
ncbi:LytTR family transcriptional regulator DNA-binding domain-containing protein, partial [Lactobacillus salivarius]|nr:LytTR family transcriptional regulator DNA-binding domain-containing protein [Ligilactobacillus salivarius]